ncbi:hypothetical protein J6590_056285 [Homalodisca vitripennis]|nr:hypothetical protein J6590_056285 [Homalodisca vitripennis]
MLGIVCRLLATNNRTQGLKEGSFYRKRQWGLQCFSRWLGPVREKAAVGLAVLQPLAWPSERNEILTSHPARALQTSMLRIACRLLATNNRTQGLKEGSLYRKRHWRLHVKSMIM